MKIVQLCKQAMRLGFVLVIMYSLTLNLQPIQHVNAQTVPGLSVHAERRASSELEPIENQDILTFSSSDGLGTNAQAALPYISCYSNGADIGAYLAADPPTAAPVRSFESLSGRHLCSVMWYQAWDTTFQPAFPVSSLNDVLLHDGYDTFIIPQLNWEPWVPLNDISTGKYDSYLTSYAAQMKTLKHTIRLRFAHEMIQDDIYCWGQPGCAEWYPWQDQPTAYVSAFRHLHDIFTTAGATNVEFVWCPNNFPFDPNVVQKYYPGSAYVDWLCMDGYNPGNKDGKPGWPDWQWFDDLFYNIYHTLADNNAVYGDKPIMIGETASCEAGPYETTGQTKAAWITNTFQRIKSPDYAQVKAFYWFNINKECDWRIDSSPQSLSAFQGAISDPYFSPHPYILISGNTGVAGTTLSYTGGIPKTIISAVDGSYSLRVWKGTVTPSHSCFTFNPASRNYDAIITDQTNQNYTPTFNNAAGCADIDVSIGATNRGRFGLPAQGSTRASFASLNDGPVEITSTNNIPLIAAERVIYKVGGVNTSFTEMMGLPDSQLNTTYWLPWYNNIDLDTQLRIGNVSGSTATVHIFIGGIEVTPVSGLSLGAGASTRLNYPGVNNGPVKIQSNQNIVAAERLIYKVSGTATSFAEMMALPNSQLNTTYWLPWYNNADLDTQLRIGNVSGNPASVHIFIGGTEVSPASGISLASGASTRLNYPGVNNGPVKIQSNENIVAAERLIYKVNGTPTSFTEMMALPNSQLNTTYWLPWYNNADLDTQLRIGNVSGNPATIHIFIGGTEVTPVSGLSLASGASTRLSYPGVNNGPVKIQSNQNIVAAERLIYKVSNIPTSFSEMMGLPNSQLDTAYWLPWYNNLDLDTQLRFGVP